MPLHIVVCIKQVLDPEMPALAFRVNRETRRVVPPPTVPQVVNDFDEVALEAALRIKDAQDAHVTALSVGAQLSLDVMRRAVALGADDLVLVQDRGLQNASDSYTTALLLAAATKKIGLDDLVLCGRQASDWDNGQVPLGVAELLGLSCVTLARKIEIQNGRAVVERFLMDSSELVEASLPAVVTVTSELGQVRYPTLREVMTARRKQPVLWAANEVGVALAEIKPRVELLDIRVPEVERRCQMVQGVDGAEAGRNLALVLREAGLI
jgi:electron transfer flavoprotein beta subunit